MDLFSHIMDNATAVFAASARFAAEKEASLSEHVSVVLSVLLNTFALACNFVRVVQASSLGNLLQNGSRSKTFVPFSSEPLHRRKTYDMKGEFASNAHRPHEAYEEAASINFSPSKPRSSPFIRCLKHV